MGDRDVIFLDNRVGLAGLSVFRGWAESGACPGVWRPAKLRQAYYLWEGNEAAEGQTLVST